MELSLNCTLAPFSEHPDFIPIPEPVRKPTQEQIVHAEDYLSQFPQVVCEVLHHFAPGVYVREGRMPAGTIATGAKHLTEHLCILAKGTIEVSTDEGMQVLTAPAIIHSKPGSKRIAYAHTDVVWFAIQHTFETDVPTIERTMVDMRRALSVDP